MSLYNQWLLSNVDIYNADDPFFTDICFSYVNLTTGVDMTLALRTEINSPPFTINCGTCAFAGIQSNYAVCNCVSQATVKVNFQNAFVVAISQLNLKVFTCYSDAINSEKIKNNPGFYFGCALFVVTITISVIYLFAATPTSQEILKIDGQLFTNEINDFDHYIQEELELLPKIEVNEKLEEKIPKRK